MADEATKRGDTAKMADYTKAAEAFANRLISVEQEAEGLKQLLLQATEAADQAKHAVRQNSMALQKKLADRQKLMGQLDQAKMQEQVNKAMTSLNETVGQDVPTLDQVRDKIEARYAKALGTAELTETSVENRMLEVEQAQVNSEAQARLAEIRSQLGLSSGAEHVHRRAGAPNRPPTGGPVRPVTSDAGARPSPVGAPRPARSPGSGPSAARPPAATAGVRSTGAGGWPGRPGRWPAPPRPGTAARRRRARRRCRRRSAPRRRPAPSRRASGRGDRRSPPSRRR